MEETDEKNPVAVELFNTVWNKLEKELGIEALVFPKRIYWLNGAPGAGKGTQTQTICDVLNIKTSPIVMSDLLQTPEMKAIKDSGKLVCDADVTALLFQKLLEPSFKDGVIVDGFPRTAVQVACLKILYKKLAELNAKNAEKFGQSEFASIILYVSEKESVERQLGRGREMKAKGLPVRETDLDPEKTAARYKVFEEMTMRPLESLKGVFPYYLINSLGSIEETRNEVRKTLAK